MNFYYDSKRGDEYKDPVAPRQYKEEKHELAVYKLDLFGYGKAGDNEYRGYSRHVSGNFTGMRPTYLLWIPGETGTRSVIMKTGLPYEK